MEIPPVSSGHVVIKNSLLHRILFLIRIACKEVDPLMLNVVEKLKESDINFSYILTKPKGTGWSNIIDFLNRNKAKIEKAFVPLILPILDDWNQSSYRGETTKAAAEIALYYLNEFAKNDNRYYRSKEKIEEKLTRIIINGSIEIKEPLEKLFTSLIEKDEVTARNPYHEIIKTCLSSVDKSARIANSIPDQIINLARASWTYTPPDREEWGPIYRNDIEQYFNLGHSHLDCYPASALQTPIFSLLNVAPQRTADFIIEFTNRSIEYHAKTDLGQREVSEVQIRLGATEPPLKQFISHRIWMMYRGGQPAPTLLESIHMALEKWLLAAAKTASVEAIESWCLYLIKQSRSASITSVVASVVMAEPYKLFKVALVLLRTKEFFYFDLTRMQFDLSAKNLYSISHDPTGLFTNERLRTCNDEHRRQTLEHIALKYQMYRNENEDDAVANQRRADIWKLLDEHYAQLQDTDNDEGKSWKLCLARMDSRKMEVSTEAREGGILLTFNPKIDPELKRHSEEVQTKISDENKYLSLRLWASHKWERNEAEYSKYLQFENDPAHVLEDIRNVCKGLNSDGVENEYFRLMYRSIPAVGCAVLIRDFSEKLDLEGLQFCKDILLNFSSLPLRGEYSYQYGDGADSAISSLPLLIREFPEYREEIKAILLLTLLDRNPVSMTGYFADYAVSAIYNSLWKISPADANSLFYGYLHLQPLYDKLCEKILRENRKKGIYEYRHFMAIQRFVTEFEQEIIQTLSNEIIRDKPPSTTKIKIDTLVTAFSLLPLDTINLCHKAFVVELTEVMAKLLERKKQVENEKVEYNTRNNFYKKFAYFVLSSRNEDIRGYIEPLLSNFARIENSEDIFQEFVSAEDKLNKYDAFWEAWNIFYPSINALCQKGSYLYSSNTVHNYLLAWPYWKKEAKEWHSLQDREKVFFQRVAREMGHHPAVLYSLAKLLNEIGLRFVGEGVFWISEILEANENFASDELETNTIYYIESFVRGFVLRNRHKVRTTPQLKAAVLVILNFLIEHGSVTGYLVREDVL